MRRLGAVILCLVASATASAGVLERTAVEALIAAKHSATGQQVEHGGMLIRRHTDYGDVVEYVEPTTGGGPTHVTVVQRDLLGPDDQLVGSYHVHLCLSGYYHAYFSTTDVITAIFSGVPEFMLDSCTGEVHEFDPKVDQIRGPGGIDAHISGPNGERLARHLPSGRIISNIGEVETERTLPDDT